MKIEKVLRLYDKFASVGGVFSTKGIAPTVMEMHGNVTRIIILEDDIQLIPER